MVDGDVVMPIGNKPGLQCDKFVMPTHYELQARSNHGQSLTRLASRGGLGWCEAAAIIEGRDWHKMDQTQAEAFVRRSLNRILPPVGME